MTNTKIENLEETIDKIVVYKKDGTMQELDRALIVPITPELIGEDTGEISLQVLVSGTVSGKEMMAVFQSMLIMARYMTENSTCKEDYYDDDDEDEYDDIEDIEKVYCDDADEDDEYCYGYEDDEDEYYDECDIYED